MDINLKYQIVVKGCDVAISTLVFHLDQYSRNHNNKFPKSFYLQMDNCWRENNNRFLLSFLAHLIHLDIFETIHLNFLMSGHTHEDVDRTFSSWSQYYWNHHIYSPNQIQSHVDNAYSNPRTKPLLFFQPCFFNFKSYYEPFLASFQNFTSYRSFQFTKNSINVVTLSSIKSRVHA